jgi:hypothetical protein
MHFDDTLGDRQSQPSPAFFDRDRTVSLPKFLKIFDWSASSMPGPVSRTATWNEPLLAVALIATSPWSVNLIALPTRLSSTCVMRRSSPRPGGGFAANRL